VRLQQCVTEDRPYRVFKDGAGDLPLIAADGFPNRARTCRSVGAGVAAIRARVGLVLEVTRSCTSAQADVLLSTAWPRARGFRESRSTCPGTQSRCRLWWGRADNPPRWRYLSIVPGSARVRSIAVRSHWWGTIPALADNPDTYACRERATATRDHQASLHRAQGGVGHPLRRWRAQAA
jgi:hypothetical protein